MRKSYSMLVVLIMSLFIGFSVKAEDTAQSQKDQKATFNDQDKAKAQKELEDLGKAFGAEPQTEKKETPQPKTIADVADKALDKVGDLVSSIASNMQKIAPEVWRIMIRQQYAKAIAGPVTPLGLLLLVFFYRHILSKRFKIDSVDNEPNQPSFWFARVIPVFFLIVFGGWLFGEIGSSVKILINPEYYAVRDLVQLLLNRGQVSG